MIDDQGRVFCDNCYASEDADHESTELVHAGETADSEDYVDLELMDLLDTDDDDGLF
jgi:hypothetical protein